MPQVTLGMSFIGSPANSQLDRGPGVALGTVMRRPSRFNTTWKDEVNLKSSAQSSRKRVGESNHLLSPSEKDPRLKTLVFFIVSGRRPAT
jgi:hypothetical protein